MIKTLIPYYYSVPLVNPNTSIVCNSYVFKIYVWNGLKTAVPSTRDYQITKINAAASNTTDKINVSRIVNDFIDFNCVQSLSTSLENGNNQVWVKMEVYYDDQPTLPQLQDTQLALKGYGFFMEGENPQPPANKILLQGDEFKVNRNGTFVLPILLSEPPPVVPSFIITSITGGDTIAFTKNFEVYDVFLIYRQTGDTDWIITTTVFSDISPIIFDIPLTGDVDVQLYTYNELINEYVFSNIFEVTI